MRESEPTSAPLPLDENSSRSVTLDGRSLILVNRRGELFLFENNCPHAQETLDPLGGSISEACGDLIKCQRHGAEFLVQTGECVAGPCMGEFLTPVAFTQVGQELYLD
ncbi:MAG: Rieske (2Fe-2S) protein [Congregibacter sp.]